MELRNTLLGLRREISWLEITIFSPLHWSLGLARFLRKKASREGRSPIRLLRGKPWLRCTWKPQRPFPDHPSSVITLVMQVLTYSFRCKPLWIGMKGRVNEDMGRGETNINQAYAILIVIFIESLLSDRHGVQHFTCTSSFNSHNTPLRYTLLSQFYRWGNWWTEKLSTLAKVTQCVIELGSQH